MKTESTKSDLGLGERVRDHLISLGLETPMQENGLSSAAKIGSITEDVRSMLSTIGMDLTDDSLADTPKRVAKMYVNELFWGLDYNNFPKITVIENKMHYDELLVERGILVQSNCEHHMLPIIGKAYVGYIPDQKVPGLSKINRVVEFFSRRPQVQERLTAQIFEALCFVLDTRNVAVTIAAEHFCVKTRGVEDPCSDTVTTKLGGLFKDSPQVRQEFYSMIQIPK